MYQKYPRHLKSNRSIYAMMFVILLLLLSKPVLGSAITVSSIADLQKAINQAKPGDQIMLADGVYTTTDDITVKQQGTREKPIIIAAQHLGKAEITGKGGFR